MHCLERTQRIRAPRETVFAFFSDPRNLARITPAALGFRVVYAPAALEAGSRLEYRIRWGPLRLRWDTRITRWAPPVEFQDLQERGPYAAWRHTHSFEEDGESTVMRDRVDYALPFGLLGRIVHRLLVERQLRRIFDFRRSTIEGIFGSG